jgi:hypothetical protein
MKHWTSKTILRLCVLFCPILYTTASPFDEVPYQKFTTLKITSFKIISRETVRVRRIGASDGGQPTDTVPQPLVSGYRIVEYNFPVAFITGLLSHPVKLDTVRNGSTARTSCTGGWGYCIVNGRYKVAVPCGFDVFKKSLTLSFTDSASSIFARYSLKKLGAFLKEITISDTATEQTYDSLIEIKRGER